MAAFGEDSGLVDDLVDLREELRNVSTERDAATAAIGTLVAATDELRAECDAKTLRIAQLEAAQLRIAQLEAAEVDRQQAALRSNVEQQHAIQQAEDTIRKLAAAMTELTQERDTLLAHCVELTEEQQQHLSSSSIGKVCVVGLVTVALVPLVALVAQRRRQ